MRSGLAVSTFLAIVLAPIAAHADTVIAGGNLSTQTWTVSNSPYIVQGDITVITGATLTIEAGVEVRAAAGSDSQVAGRDHDKVEITVSGSLVANGTAASPVVFKSASPTKGSWFGIIAVAGATQVKLDHVDIQYAIDGVTGETAGSELQLTNSVVRSSSRHGVALTAGTPAVTGVSAWDSGGYGFNISGSASPSLVRCAARGSVSGGIYISPNTPGRTVSISNCTLHQNGTFGIYSTSINSNEATINLKNSIVTGSSYGLYRGDDATWNVSYTNVWNNSSTDIYPSEFGANMIRANPLYVSPTDLRLTSNSPSRFSSDNGVDDQGAMPYDGVATPGLYGTLWSNTTLLASMGSYTAAGDLSVAPGVTLTIEPGVTLSFTSSSDIMKARDTDHGELIVRGTLVANGTPANPITITSSSPTKGTWYGVELEGMSHDSVLDDLRIAYPIDGVTYVTTGTGNQISNSIVDSASRHGYVVRTGSPTLDGVHALSSGGYGFYVTESASPTFTRCLARDSVSGGMYISPNTPGRSVSITRCTFHHNGTFGIYSTSINSNEATVNVVGSIVTSSSYGLYRGDDATWNVMSTNVWNNSSTNIYPSPFGTDMISANPLYVSNSDLRLTSNSPSRFGAPGNLDQGALPYDGVATPGLYGTLWVNTTLTAAGGPYTSAGDLTVGPNVTLTIEPGATMSFTSSSDIMRSHDEDHGELIVKGTLVADGTPQSPITIGSTSSTKGTWYGIDFDTAAHASVLDNVIIRYPIYGLQYRSTGTGNVFTRITVDSASQHGVYLRQGTPSINGLTAIASGGYGVNISESASAQVSNCVIRGSVSGGFQISPNTPGRSVAITNCTLNQNGTFGIYSTSINSNEATITVTNTIVTSSSYGFYKGDDATWNASYCDVWNNSSTNIYPSPFGTNILSANPQYVSANDLHVASTSVAIDAGTTGPADDLDGHARPLDGNGVAGAQWDMGAYEYISMIQCGNGAVEGSETCDDGAMNGTYGHCNAQCNGMGPRCGDGTMNGPEQCDDANASNTDACLNTCVSATCGDGFTLAGTEQCDDANASNTDACLNTCMAATCGDGFVREGMEPCDDGNQSNTDACLNTCEVASCGDGYAQAGVEECDDGNMANTDACLNVCKSAACGDGFTETGVEGCDDGNMVDTDMCSNTCVASTCGNGVTEGNEQCDDGNEVESDMCRNNCVDARCGDGVIAGGVEECDDGNTDPGDGCDEICATEGGDNPMPDNPGDGGGCCDSSTRGGEAGSLFLAAFVLLGLRRRRR